MTRQDIFHTNQLHYCSPFRIHTAAVCIFLALNFFPLDNSFAQFEKLNEMWRWTRFTSETGLPSNEVIDIVETSVGTPWVATSHGVAWYDGFQWNPVADPSGRLTQKITSLMADNSDSIYVISDKQLYKGGKNGFREITVEYEGVKYPIVSMGITEDGTIFLQGTRKTLFIYLHGKISKWTIPARFISDEPWIHNTRRKTIWISTIKGVYRWEKNKWNKIIGFTGPITDVKVVEDPNGRGLISVACTRGDGGLFRWDEKGGLVHYTSEGLNVVQSMDLSGNGDAIVAYVTGDTRWHANSRWISVSFGQKQYSRIMLVRFRRNGDLWFATEQGLSLFRLSQNRWEYIKHPFPNINNTIHEICLHSSGRLYLGIPEGIEIIDRDGSSRIISSINGERISVVTGIVEDNDGALWISSGKSFEGAYRWDGRQWQHFGEKEGLDVKRIHKIRCDREGRLWFLGISPNILGEGENEEPGCFVFDGSRFIHWGTKEGLPSGRIYSFAEGKDSSLWFGTLKGLSRWRAGRWKHWIELSESFENRIWQIAFDSTNRLWISDRANGIGYIEKEEKIQIVRSPVWTQQSQIWDIVSDRDHRVWFSSSSGLLCYHEDVWTKFDLSKGLSNLHLWPLFTTKDKLYIGTLGSGVNILDLRAVSKYPPIVTLLPITMDGHNVSIHWIPLSFWGEDQYDEIEVRYRLDNNEWSEWTVRNQLFIPHVSSGAHRFTIQAKGLFGNFNSTGSSLTFYVESPFYLRPEYFVPISVLGLFSIVVFLVNRIRRSEFEMELIKAEKRLRQVIDLVPHYIYAIDIEGSLILANKSFAASLDLNAQELAGKKLADIAMNANEAKRMMQDDRDVLEQRYPKFIFEEVYTDKREITHWLQTTKIPFDTYGDFAVLAVSIDMTQRRVVEYALRDSEIRFMDIAYSSSDWIWEVNMQGIYTYSSEKVKTILGYDRDELVGKPIAFLLAPEEIERTYAFFENVKIQALPILDFENWNIAKGGRRVCLLTNGVPVYDTGGKMMGYRGMDRDITEQRKYERELKEYLGRLRLLSGRIEKTREEERTWIARDIHDELGQALTSMRIDLGWMQKKFAHSQQALKSRCVQVIDLVDHTIRYAQEMSTRLRPVLLENVGLKAAIEWYLKDFCQRTRIRCADLILDDNLQTSKEKETALFRVLQEALTNISRHAKATVISIKLYTNDELIHLIIRDNGKGIKNADAEDPRSLGVIGMRERVLTLKGDFSISGSSVEGTIIHVQLPLTRKGAA